MHHPPQPSFQRARHGVLACAIGRAFLGLAAAAPLVTLAAPAAAQEARNVAGNAADTVRNFSIPAGPMGATLNRFGREAGVMLSFSSQATGNLHSPGVSGVHTPASGLAVLLKGSGLVASRQGNGGYVIAAGGPSATSSASPSMEDDSAAAMPMVHVVAQGQEASTEGTGSYGGRRTTIGKM